MEIDRLPDWAFTDEELDQMAKEVLGGTNLDVATKLGFYHMHKDGVDTGVVILLTVESISDGLHAINRLWSQYGMYAEIGEFTEEASYAAGYRLQTLEVALNKFRYVGKIQEAGTNKLYRYKTWMAELL